MSWRDSLLECKFRDVVLDIVGTRDSFARAVSVAEVPFVDGGVTDDLGGRPARISLQVVFFGDDYEARLFEALAAFNTAGPGELVHPVFGSIPRAQVMHVEVTHSAPEPDSCTVAVELVEDGEPLSFFEKAEAAQVQATVGTRNDSILDEATSWLRDIVDAIREAAPLQELAELRTSMLDPLLGFVGEVQGIVTSGLDVLDEPRAWARDIAALSNGVIAIASFGDNLMQDWRAITDVFSRLGHQYGYGASATTPGSAGASPWLAGTSPSESQGVATVSAWLAVNNATAQADVAAIVLAAEAEAPTLSPNEIETVVAGARAEIDAAIEAVRAVLPIERSRAVTESLKDQALALQDAGRALIELRPPLVLRAIEGPGNLRLIAHRWYGDHTRAPELARLNNFRNPNALQMGDAVRGYTR